MTANAIPRATIASYRFTSKDPLSDIPVPPWRGVERINTGGGETYYWNYTGCQSGVH